MTGLLQTHTRLLVTASLLAAAFICYGIGFTVGFQVFFLLGAALETVFWARLFLHRPRRQARLDALKNRD